MSALTGIEDYAFNTASDSKYDPFEQIRARVRKRDAVRNQCRLNFFARDYFLQERFWLREVDGRDDLAERLIARPRGEFQYDVPGIKNIRENDSQGIDRGIGGLSRRRKLSS